MRHEGEVSWFNERRGFGFITDDGGSELFVHYTEITRNGFQTLAPGERVSYEIVDAGRGAKAVDVRIPGETPRTSIL